MWGANQFGKRFFSVSVEPKVNRPIGLCLTFFKEEGEVDRGLPYGDSSLDNWKLELPLELM